MNALIVYEPGDRNVEEIAQIAAQVLRRTSETRLVALDAVSLADLEWAELLVAGGPTRLRTVSPAFVAWLDGIPAGALHGARIAAFDTRYRGLVWMTGQAAPVIAQALAAKGGREIVPPESFFAELAQEVRLEPGELERVTVWACSILERVPEAALALR